MNDEQHDRRARQQRITPKVHRGFTTKSKRRRDWKRRMRHYVMLGLLNVMAIIAVIFAVAIYQQMVKDYHPFQYESPDIESARLNDASLLSQFDAPLSR